MVLSFLRLKVVLFYEIIGGVIQCQLTYIFDPAGNRVNFRGSTHAHGL